jgi:hypothetical protein
MLRTLCEWMEALPSSVALRESLNAYPVLLTSHVIGMCLFAGLVMMMDLRLAGFGNSTSSITQIQKRLFPWQMLGFGLSVVTGALLFYGQPMRFYPNFYFWIKNLLLVLAALNMWYFHITTYQTVEEWNTDPRPPTAARTAGVLSLAFWSAIIVVGRMIAYPGLVPQWWLDLGLEG